jgi:hypothetical protein
MRKLDPTIEEELQWMFHVGMGRAILFLMNQDLSHYRELILDSCLHNYAYDHQVEGTRAEYLYPLIRKSGEEDYYRREILRAIPEATDWSDAEQLLDFAVIFARQGDEQAREALYNNVRQLDNDVAGEDQVIELDGVKGLIFLLDLIGQDSQLMARYEDGFVIEKAEETSSVEEVRLALQKAASENSNVAAALAGVMDYSVEWSAEDIILKREERRHSLLGMPSAELSESASWEEVKTSLHFSSMAFSWARSASSEELVKAAKDLNPEDEPERLQSHLFIFRKRPFPLEPEPLIKLIDHPNETVGIRAIIALELVQHSKVRDLTFRLLNEPKWSDRAIGLLRSNYESGDSQLIKGLLEQETDPDRLHLMCIDTMDVFEDNPVQEGLQPLLTVYEKDPCSVCRCTCIKTVQKIDAVPDWMIEECLCDAYPHTRELAKEFIDL